MVAADSKGEALAFLACLFRDSAIATRWGDLAAVFTSVQALRKLAASTAAFVPIVSSEEAEHELATIFHRVHCIVVRPRNAIDSNADIALDLLDHQSFEKALHAMGIKDDEVERLARKSGRSPTILRRQLARVYAIRTPEWAREAEMAKALIPMAMIGSWRAEFSADLEVLGVLSGGNHP